MALDSNDPKIKQAIDEVKNPSSQTNWLLLGYVPKSDTKLALVDSGSDGLKALVDQLNDGKIFFGLVSYDINNTKKFVYIAWCGEGVTGMKKGLFNNHANDVARLFKGFHVQINARNEDDLSEKGIVDKLKKATGASYDSGAKIQGTGSGTAPANVAQAKQQVTAPSSGPVKASFNRADYNKKEESEKFWQQQRQEEERAKQERAQQPQRGPVSTGSVKGRFEAAAAKQNEPAPRPAPVVNRVAQTPSRPAPTPVREAPTPPKEEYVPAPVEEAPPAPVEQQQDEWQEEPQQQYQEEYQQEQQQDQYQDQYQQPEESYDQQQSYDQQESYDQSYDQQQSYDQSEDQPQTYDDQQSYEQQSYEQQPEEQYAASSYVTQARAIYAYDAENEGDLSFQEGDLINIMDKSDPSGWWQGELNGAVGFFPSNFVEEI